MKISSPQEAKLFSLLFIIISLTYTPFLLDPAQLGRFILLSISLMILVFFVLNKDNLTIWREPVILVYLSLVIFNFASVLWSLNPGEAIYESSKTFLGFLLFLLTISLLRRNEKVETHIIYASIILLFTFLIIILLDYSKINFNFFDRDLSYNITGLNGHKNQLSIFVFLLSAFLALGIQHFKNHGKVIASFAFAIAFLAIIILQTRSVWLGYFIVGITSVIFYAVFFKDKKFWKVKRWQGIVMIFLTFSGIGLLVYLIPANFNMYNLNSRLLIWEKTVSMFKENPFIGVGAGNWRFNFAAFGLEGFGTKVQNGLNIAQRPHNDFLWILSETGLIGFSLYISFLIAFIRVVFLKIRNSPANKSIYSISIPFAYIIGYLAISFFTFSKERIEQVFILNILMAFAYFSSSKKWLSEAKQWHFRFQNLFRIFLFILLTGILGIGIFRARGEYYAKEIIVARTNGNHQKVILSSDKAFSYFYTVDNFAMPLDWYKGSAYVSLGSIELALLSFKKAYKISPYNVQVLNNLGSSYEVTGDHNNAKKIYKEAIQISPDFSDPKLNLAVILYNKGEYEDALDWVRQVNDHDRRRPYIKAIRKKIDEKKKEQH